MPAGSVPRSRCRSGPRRGCPAGTEGSASGEPSQLSLRLLQIERHVHLAVHRRRSGEVLARLLGLAFARAQLPEAEVAVGDERTHAARLCEGQRLAVVGLAALGVELLGVGRDVPEQMDGIGLPGRVVWRGVDSELAKAAGLLQSV